MTSVAVVAHAGKSFGGGLDELRQVLADFGVLEPLWYEVPKSRKAPKRARQAIAEGADLVFVWGGDGTVQRCVDELAGSAVPVAIVPAGTANLLATNLGIPKDIIAAVRIGLHGAHRTIDLGRVNGEHFAVMAGAGFDARMIRDADRGLKDRIGRLAYVVTGARHLRGERAHMRIRVDGDDWFEGDVGCLLLGNVGRLFGGIEVFADADPTDGELEVGIVTAEGFVQWVRALGRTAVGRPERSPFVQTTRGRRIDVKLRDKIPYEMDGGDRTPTDRLKFRVDPAAITICVPPEGEAA